MSGTHMGWAFRKRYQVGGLAHQGDPTVRPQVFSPVQAENEGIRRGVDPETDWSRLARATCRLLSRTFCPTP
jgi:hypothetical protein